MGKILMEKCETIYALGLQRVRHLIYTSNYENREKALSVILYKMVDEKLKWDLGVV